MIEVHANSITLKGAEKRPIVLFGAWPHEVKIFTKPEELAEWERRARAILGPQVTAQAVMAGGGCCCGTDGGMCDSD